MNQKTAGLGEQEWELLRWVSDQTQPVTVREAARAYGEPRGLARTTILTVMERLRQKNLLVRDKDETEAAFRYRPAQPKTDLMRGMVANFVEKTLGGSLAPFVAYLTDADHLSERERGELRRLVAQLDGQDEAANTPSEKGK